MALAALASSIVLAQGVSLDAPRPATAEGEKPEPVAIEGLSSMSWLAGCWQGSVNKRDFREHWLPLQSDDVMIGASQTAQGGKMQDFEYLRLERRSEGLFYVAMPSGQKVGTFRLGDVTRTEAGTTYPFLSGGTEFPQRIEYRRATEGWLYVTVEGTAGGKERKVIYPMRRVDCESGEFIRQ